jgi:hypothetical protein
MERPVVMEETMGVMVDVEALNSSKSATDCNNDANGKVLEKY